jgi:hypothetical protein
MDVQHFIRKGELPTYMRAGGAAARYMGRCISIQEGEDAPTTVVQVVDAKHDEQYADISQCEAHGIVTSRP